MDITDILIRPVISEKANMLREGGEGVQVAQVLHGALARAALAGVPPALDYREADPAAPLRRLLEVHRAPFRFPARMILR